jgi:hypothetical protein
VTWKGPSRLASFHLATAPMPESRNMLLVVCADYDSILSRRNCPACDDPFEGGMEVFVSVDEAIAIHAQCVTALAMVASLRSRDDADVEDEAAEKTEELLRAISR